MLKKSIAFGLAALALSASAVTAFAPAASAAGCVKSDIPWTKKQAPNTSLAFPKPADSRTTCNDLNLTSASNRTESGDGRGYDKYAGVYRTSTGWKVGTRGYQRFNDYRDEWMVLLSDVNPGTYMTVASWYDEGDSVQIAY